MAKEKEVCAAHEILLSNLRGIEKNQSQLFDLDREKATKLGAIEVSVARLQEVTAAGFEGVEKQSALLYANTASEIAKLSAIVAKASLRKRWTPRTVIALFSSMFGSGSIGYVFALWITKRLG